MVITVDLDSNRIVEQPGVLGSPNDLTTPRATAVPLTVQFCRGGVIVDPEAKSAEILTSSTGSGTIFYAPAHPFAVNDEISISGHTGLPIDITSSSASATAATITTASDHGMTTGGNGTGINGIALAAGKFLVNIAGHDTAGQLTGNISTTTAANPVAVTTTAAHGLSTGDLITVTGCTRSAVNTTASIIVTGATTFTMTGVDATAGTGASGTFLRKASDINGQHIATWVSSTTFTIPKANYSVLTGGAMAVTTTTPIANTADGVTRTVTAVTTNTFTVGALNLTAAGTGGIATKITSLALRWTVKNDGEYDGAMVAYVNTFTKYGGGSTTSFKGTCDYTTVELNSILGIDASTSGSISGITGNTWTSTAHGLAAGDSIVFSAATIPGGVIEEQTYYILTAPTATTFTIAATVGGTVITPTSSGTTVTFVGYPTVDDETSATLMAELKWTGAQPSKTNWIRHYVRNDLYKGDESTPVSAAGQIGSTTIPDGTSEIAVTFSPALSTANWHFMGAPYVENTTASALGISFEGLSAKSDTGFTAILSGAADATGTYNLKWIVQPD